MKSFSLYVLAALLPCRDFIHNALAGNLVAVYVPTTPNPTSGPLEIVPLGNVTSTNRSFDEAMSFIISGGAVASSRMNFDKSIDLRDLIEKDKHGISRFIEKDRLPPS